jgi:selenocysteine lyase/cysteine desulfurase
LELHCHKRKDKCLTFGLASDICLLLRMVLAHIRTIPELILLGSSSQSVKRLPIFSFMVRHPRGTFLHHNFVCTVLNDVFGIQARGGCACAGPYAQDLLGIDEQLAQEYEAVLLEDS